MAQNARIVTGGLEPDCFKGNNLDSTDILDKTSLYDGKPEIPKGTALKRVGGKLLPWTTGTQCKGFLKEKVVIDLNINKDEPCSVVYCGAIDTDKIPNWSATIKTNDIWHNFQDIHLID